jgi:hypothetical protein
VISLAVHDGTGAILYGMPSPAPRVTFADEESGMHGYRRRAGAIDAQVKQLRAAGAAKVWRETARGARGAPQPHHGCPLDHC